MGKKKNKRKDKKSRTARLVRGAGRSVILFALGAKGGVHDRFRKGYNRAQAKKEASKEIDE